jgi:sugar phosphate isomerase/epimerase
MKLRLLCPFIILAGFSPLCLAEWELFAMDTGTRDSQTRSYDQQAALVKELGFPGIGYTGANNIPGMLAATGKHKIRFAPLYNGIEVRSNGVTNNANLEKAISQLKGRKAIVWLYVGGRRPADPSTTDAPVVAKLQELADLAEKSSVRLALYPHAGAYADRVQDCVRLVKAADRRNLGVTFNLCHFLKVDGRDLDKRLEEAAPHLFVVTINGADKDGTGWNTLIQPLDTGTYDVLPVLRKLKSLKWDGLVGLQHYGIRGSARDNLGRSMKGWKTLLERLGAE